MAACANLVARNQRTSTMLGDRIEPARTWLRRLRGLLGRRRLEPGEGLLIEPCTGVHMLGMRFAIDVVFLDREGVVVRCDRRLRPYRVVPWVRCARSALELPAGTIEASGTAPGDRIEIRPAPVETGASS